MGLCNLKLKKRLTYTLDETKKEIETLQVFPKAVIIHVGTNNLKMNTVEEVSNKISDVTDTILKKAPHTKVIISNIVSRDDNHKYQMMLDYVNACVNLKYSKTENVSISKNINIGKNCRANDGTHLKPIGTSKLASNLKYSVMKALNIKIEARVKNSYYNTTK